MYKWISSFVYHRMAREKLDGALSIEIRLKEGVPQGSVLSPTLFLLYVNDIVNTLPPKVTNSLHADDLAAWTSAEHTSIVTHVMQKTINRVSSWANEWCTEINCSKTQAALFSLSTVKEKVLLKLKDMPVPQVDNSTGQTVSYSNATSRKCSNFKAETSALQTAVAYIAGVTPQKIVILTDSKAALQSLTSNTPDQPIHQLLKDLQLLPHECTVVLQ